MSDTSTALLRKAYSHIENDEREKAQEILAPLLEDDANNAHLWWVYTHAVQDASIGQAALERVLEIDPQYPGARELKADVLEAQSKDPDLIALGAGESGAESEASPLEIDDWEDLQPVVETTAGGSSTRARSILLAIVLVVIAGGAIVLSGAVDLNELLAGILPSPSPQVIIVAESTGEPPSANDARAATASSEAGSEVLAPRDDEASSEGGEGGPAATASQRESELAPVETAEATATAGATATPSPTISPGSARVATFIGFVADEIVDFPIDPSQSGTLPTGLGDTLIVAACAIPGPELNARLERVLSTVVSLADRLPDGIEAVAAGLRNCDDADASLRIIGVTRETLLAFANEEIKAKEFQRAWQPMS